MRLYQSRDLVGVADDVGGVGSKALWSSVLAIHHAGRGRLVPLPSLKLGWTMDDVIIVASLHSKLGSFTFLIHPFLTPLRPSVPFLFLFIHPLDPLILRIYPSQQLLPTAKIQLPA